MWHVCLSAYQRRKLSNCLSVLYLREKSIRWNTIIFHLSPSFWSPSKLRQHLLEKWEKLIENCPQLPEPDTGGVLSACTTEIWLELLSDVIYVMSNSVLKNSLCHSPHSHRDSSSIDCFWLVVNCWSLHAENWTACNVDEDNKNVFGIMQNKSTWKDN